MIRKSKVKSGENVVVTTGKYRNSRFIVKGIDRKKGMVFLKNLSRVVFVMNRKERKYQAKEVFIPIDISNISQIKE